MQQCFVIQPFDGKRFDKRYNDTFAPAIKAAGMEPYRIDQDPTVEIPIEEIESKIRASHACLVDISMDNPNVWYELGFSIASRKEVVLICSTERNSKFPFDVQHRTIIQYSTDSLSDFEVLKSKITKRLLAIKSRNEKLNKVVSDTQFAEINGLSHHEMVALTIVAETSDEHDGSVSSWAVKNSMDNQGFTKLATVFALAGLIEKQMLTKFTHAGSLEGEFTAYKITDSGMKWLLSNQELFQLNKGKGNEDGNSIPQDDVPF